MPADDTNAQTRLARIERMMEAYRLAKQRRLLRQAKRIWRQTETRQQIARLEALPERVH